MSQGSWREASEDDYATRSNPRQRRSSSSSSSIGFALPISIAAALASFYALYLVFALDQRLAETNAALTALKKEHTALQQKLDDIQKAQRNPAMSGR